MALTSDRHNPNRELIGQGIANIVVPFMAGIPATAAIARTAAGIRNGSTSRLTGVVHAATVLILTVLLARVAGQIPLAVLAAILVVVAYSIADVPELVRLARTAPREDLIALVSTVTITIFLDLTYAIAIGIITSTVLLLRRLNRVPVVHQVLSDVADTDDTDSEPTVPIPPTLAQMLRHHPELLVFNAQGIISFHSAAAFEATLPRHDPRPLLIRMQDIHHVDTSGLITLSGIIEHRRRAGARTFLTDVRPEVEVALRRFGIHNLVGQGGLGDSTQTVLRALIEEGELPHPGVPVLEPALESDPA